MISKAADQATMSISISRPAVEVDGLPVATREALDIAFRKFEPEDMEKIRVDAEILSSLLRDKPKEMIAIANDVISGRTDSAQKLAASIGLTEKDFQRQGGGVLFWCGILLFGGYLLVVAATQRPQ